ncbi:MAG: four helix bundle protein [Candidatus Yonathbacteria bacterium]|nr:four helix bundle protein [Candidatus Yonathbacteria bacterium]
MTTIYKIFRFREFPVYADARIFITSAKKIFRTKFPKHEQFSLLQQLCRALDSIVLNIAEGANRGTDKDFAHFLNISQASLSEVVACFDVALDNEYFSPSEHNGLLKNAEFLAYQLNSFRNSIVRALRK